MNFFFIGKYSTKEVLCTESFSVYWKKHFIPQPDLHLIEFSYKFKN